MGQYMKIADIDLLVNIEIYDVDTSCRW